MVRLSVPHALRIDHLRLIFFLAVNTRDREMADKADDRDPLLKSARPPMHSAGLPRPTALSRPDAGVSHASTPQRRETELQSRVRDYQVDVRTLIVGSEMSLSGEITSCSRLIVEGTVAAKLDKCQHVIIAEPGIFKGDATTDNADVHGCFEGNLVVRKRLLIRATGRVSGTITYGEIEIECGGKISGTTQAHEGGGAISHVGRARLG
jgi:cytoskeletal protein CcmA (bactofilin family)